MEPGHRHRKVLCSLLAVLVGSPTGHRYFHLVKQTHRLHVKPGSSLDTFFSPPLPKQLLNFFFLKCVLSSLNWQKALNVGTTRTKWHVVKAFPEWCLYPQNSVSWKISFKFFFWNKYEVFLPSPELVNLWQNSSPTRLSSTQLFYISKQKNMKWLVATFSDIHLFLNFIIITVQLKNNSEYLQLHKAHGAPAKDAVHEPDPEGPVPSHLPTGKFSSSHQSNASFSTIPIPSSI